MLSKAPVLRHFTPGLPVVLHTDASLFAIGGWIGQVFGGTVHPVAYWSKKLIPAETRYPTHYRELLALVRMLQKYRHWLLGATVMAYTDHRALVHLQSQESLSDRQARLVEVLQEFDLTIADIPGPENHLADFLSRLPAHAPRCIRCSDLLRSENFLPDDMLEGETDVNEISELLRTSMCPARAEVLTPGRRAGPTMKPGAYS